MTEPKNFAVKRKIINLFIISIFALGFGQTKAKEYLGFDICSKFDEKTIYEKIGIFNIPAENVTKEDDPKILNYYRLILKDAEIEGRKYTVTVFVYNGKLNGISIKNPFELIKIIEGKYGKPVNIENKSLGVLGSTIRKNYQPSDDKSVSLQESFIEFSGLSIYSLYYKCKAIENEVEKESKRIEQLEERNKISKTKL